MIILLSILKKFTPFVLLCLVSSYALSTTLTYVSFDQLVEQSDGIIEATVANKISSYGTNNNIYTLVTLKDLIVLKGYVLTKTLDLRFDGGRVENRIQEISGAPRLNEEDRVILFVRGNGKYMIPIVGWEQGVFRVVQDPYSKEKVIADANWNRLTGLSMGQVEKEDRFPSQAHIVGVISNRFSANIGSVTEISNNEHFQHQITATSKAFVSGLMPYAVFVSEIESRVLSNGRLGQLIYNAVVSEIEDPKMTKSISTD